MSLGELGISVGRFVFMTLVALRVVFARVALPRASCQLGSV